MTNFTPVIVKLRRGRQVLVRAIRADDSERLQTAIRALSDESRYFRFMAALKELPPGLVDLAIRPPDGRQLQLVAVTGEGSAETIVAGARYSSEAGSSDCEFAVAVTDEWHGLGLARRLLELLIADARARGFARMEGYILASNTRMLGLARHLGFVVGPSPEDPSLRRVRRELT